MQVIPFSPNRNFVYEHLSRARRFHCSVTGTFDYDVTELAAALASQREEGRSINMMAVLVKATGIVMQRHPRMNRHVFHRWGRRYEVDFGRVSCTLIVGREGSEGEPILFPVLIEEPQHKSLDAIYAEIRHHKVAPLETLPQIAAFERVKKMPRWMMRWFSYRARSDPRFYTKYFGTYGLSSMFTRDWGGIAGSALANTGSGFQPGVLRDEAVVRTSEVVVRKILKMNIVADHFLLDGMDILGGMQELRSLLETTQLLDSGAVLDG
jgi:pyruvate/2-oxoglutarate dehydrogenase complex dihydrolipoamide acyltransferase (E2) component